MLSIKYIRDNESFVKECLESKNAVDIDIDNLLSIDKDRRRTIVEVENLKSKRNSVSKEIAKLKSSGDNADEMIVEMKRVSSSIKSLDDHLNLLNDQLKEILYSIPNIISPTTPIGKSDDENKIIREWGEKPSFDFELKGHLDLIEKLELVDFSKGSLLSGSGFPFYIGQGAKLERSLINYMIDYQANNNGYTEVFPPFLVNRASMVTTGQLPKFADDMYTLEKDELFCIPTAEVPITNIYRNKVLREDELPLKIAGYSACFRREAGSYGKETRGLLRVHQFNKVELVQFSKPENSYYQLEEILNNAEQILQNLGLHYRVVELCSGDLSFSAAKCYDIEVWSPFEKKYLEVSSCSNFLNFQSYRGNIKYKCKETGKHKFVHTLNGSGLATPRLFVAIVETYQTKSGKISIPNPLVGYMGTKEIK